MDEEYKGSATIQILPQETEEVDIDTRFQTVAVAVLGKHIKKFDKIITDINILVKLVSGEENLDLERCTEKCTSNFKRISDIVKQIPFASEAISSSDSDYKDILEGNYICNTAVSILSGSFKALLIYGHVRKVLEHINQVGTKLLVMSIQSQAECEASYSNVNTRLSVGPDPNPDYDEQQQSHMPQQMEAGSVSKADCEELLESFDRSRNINNIKHLGAKYEKLLRSFNTRLQRFFELAKMFNEKQDPKVYNRSLSSLKDILTGEEDLQNTEEALLRGLLLPSHRAQEVHSVQPLLTEILCSLGSMLEKEDVQKNSPVKPEIQPNRNLRGTGTKSRKTRIVDKTITANGRFIFLFRDDAIEIPVEMKPGLRATVNNPEDLLEEGRDQVIGHLAKHVGIGFNFAGVGIDTKATGVILTPVYVKIIQLGLKNMGTLETKLVLRETELMPLMSTANFDKWTNQINADSDKVGNWDSMRLQLYGVNGLDDKEVPSGLVALCNLMTSRRKDLVGHDYFESSEDLGNIIGFGSFSVVYAKKDNDDLNHIVKLSRYGSKALLDRETIALKALKGEATENGIVSFINIAFMSITIGGSKIQLPPALTMKPLGMSVGMYLAEKNPGERNSALRKISEQLHTALEFIHGKEYSHNDVSCPQRTL